MTLDMILNKENFERIGYKRSDAPAVGGWQIYSKLGKVVWVKFYYSEKLCMNVYDVRKKNPMVNNGRGS